MAQLKNHSGFWLRDDAAAAFDRAEDDHGVFTVNSAGRTVTEQQNLINRYAVGGAANRPPYLYRPANPPQASNHVANGGVAADLGDWRRFAAICENYGFRHTYPDGDPVHFDFIGFTDVKAAPTFNQNTLNRQVFLNKARNANLVEDGREGPLSKSAYKAYQTYLFKQKLYTDDIDGVWGPNTEKAHAADVRAHPLPVAAPPAAVFHTATVADLRGLGDTRGLQKVAKLYGYRGGEDNNFGTNSQVGLQTFLNRHYGGSLASWLRKKWGYSGNDLWGPVMTAAAVRANLANLKAL